MDPAHIVLADCNISDAYALRTLANHLDVERSKGSFTPKVSFTDRERKPSTANAVMGFPMARAFNANLTVGAYSSVLSGCDLLIDVDILKNCVTPVPLDKKTQLRDYYGLDSEKRLVAVTHLNVYDKFCRIMNLSDFAYSEVAADFITTTSGVAPVYLFDAPKDLIEKVEPFANVNLIDIHGVLKDYLSVADVCVDAGRSIVQIGGLHNVIEATENGVFFCIPRQEDRGYFGFNQLAEGGSIRTFNSLNSLEAAVFDYLQNPEDAIQARVNRAAHLKETRDRYLPVITQLLNAFTRRNPVAEGISSEALSIDLNGLKLKQLDTGQAILYHPVSSWKLPKDRDILPPPIV